MRKLKGNRVQNKKKSLKVRQTNGTEAYEKMIKGYIYDKSTYSRSIYSPHVYSESAKHGRVTIIN